MALDYSKWDVLAREIEHEEEEEKDKRRRENRERYMKEQDQKKKQFHKDNPDYVRDESHSCGCSMRPGQLEKLKSGEVKKDDIPLDERNRKKKLAILAAKQDGNRLFQEGDYDTAFAVYERGALICNGVYGVSDEEFKEISHLEKLLDLNMAAVRIKQQLWLDAINQCKMVLNIDEKCAKAYFRIGQAHIGMANYDEARSALQKALELAPADKAIISHLAKVDELQRIQDEKERQFQKSIMGKLRT